MNVVADVRVNTAQSHRPERRVALVRTSEAGTAAIQLVESMLWAFQGTMRSNWVASKTTTEADVIIIGDVVPDERMARWRSKGKPIIAITAAGAATPEVEHILVYPFRATQLLQLLNSLDAKLSGPVAAALEASAAAAPSTTAAVAAPKADPWSFVETLRTLRAVQNAQVWLNGMQGSAPILWLKGDGTEYCADNSTLQDIRRGTFPFSAVQMRKGAAPPAHRPVRPAAELEWFAGCNASDQLAPWLNPSAAYRITRWPNFGLIRPLPSQIRVTALLSSGPMTLQQLTRRAGAHTVEIIRTLNALETSGLLTVAEAAPVAAKDAVPRANDPQPPGGIAAFVRAVRKRLGMSEKP